MIGLRLWQVTVATDIANLIIKRKPLACMYKKHVIFIGHCRGRGPFCFCSKDFFWYFDVISVLFFPQANSLLQYWPCSVITSDSSPMCAHFGSIMSSDKSWTTLGCHGDVPIHSFVLSGYYFFEDHMMRVCSC